MTKTPEEMADEYCEDHDECEFARDAFLAGYKAASDKHVEQIRHLEMELQQAKLLAMKLEAER